MPTQLQLPLFPLNQCGRSTAPCPLTLHSSAIVCSVCGCTAPIRLANPCEQLMRADPFQNDEGLSRPDSAAGKLQRVLLKLLREHERDDALPTNGRFLFYELIGLKVVSKQKKSKGRRSDQNMHDALTHLRDKGIVPWSWIADETRSLVDYTGWHTIADWATTMVEVARLCPWRGRAPLVLTESRSLSGVLSDLAHEYAVKLAPTNGHVGGFLHNDIAPVLQPADRVLYIGDFDWCGHQIENNTRSVLERLVGGDLNWTRIALTAAQVEQYNLSDKQIMKADHRYKPVRHYPAVETEALKQHVVVRIIRDALRSCRRR